MEDLMSGSLKTLTQTAAIVAKPETLGLDGERYLLITPAGSAAWIEQPEAATAFASMREATRMAARLPSVLRAFSLPQTVELTVHQLH
jgi:hypothetical protein